jgi:hypothetical protein
VPFLPRQYVVGRTNLREQQRLDLHVRRNPLPQRDELRLFELPFERRQADQHDFERPVQDLGGVDQQAKMDEQLGG